MDDGLDEFSPNASAKLSKLFEDPLDNSNLSTDFSNFLPGRKKTETPTPCKVTLIQAYVVSCFMLKTNGYESMGHCGLALLGNDSSAYYIIYVYRKDNSRVCRVEVQPDLEFEVESKNYLCFKDREDRYWSLNFKNDEDVYNFLEKVLILRWKVNRLKPPLNLSTEAIIQKISKGDGKLLSLKRPVEGTLTCMDFVDHSLSKKKISRVEEGAPIPPWMQRVMPRRLKIDDEFILMSPISIGGRGSDLPTLIRVKLLQGRVRSEKSEKGEMDSCAPSAPTSRPTSPDRPSTRKVATEVSLTAKKNECGEGAVDPFNSKKETEDKVNALIEKIDSLTSLVGSVEEKLLIKTEELHGKMYSLEEHIRNLSAASHVNAQVIKESQNKIIGEIGVKLADFKNDIIQNVKDLIEVNSSQSASGIKEIKDTSERLIRVMERSHESAIVPDACQAIKEAQNVIMDGVADKLDAFSGMVRQIKGDIEKGLFENTRQIHEMKEASDKMIAAIQRELSSKDGERDGEDAIDLALIIPKLPDFDVTDDLPGVPHTSEEEEIPSLRDTLSRSPFRGSEDSVNDCSEASRLQISDCEARDLERGLLEKRSRDVELNQVVDF